MTAPPWKRTSPAQAQQEAEFVRLVPCFPHALPTPVARVIRTRLARARTRLAWRSPIRGIRRRRFRCPRRRPARDEGWVYRV